MTWDIPPFLAQKITRSICQHAPKPLRTLVLKLRPSGRPWGTSPQRDSWDRWAERPKKKKRRTSAAWPHFLWDNSYILLHPWINEIPARQTYRDAHGFPNPSKSKYGNVPLDPHLRRCLSNSKEGNLLYLQFVPWIFRRFSTDFP